MLKNIFIIITMFVALLIPFELLAADGYKGVQWGASVEDSKRILESDLGEDINVNTKIAKGYLDYLFFSIFNIPKEKSPFGGRPYFLESYLPGKFQRYDYENDYLLFYNNKYLAYVFEVNSRSYSKFKSELTSKYGKPQNNTYTHYQEEYFKHSFNVSTWNKGSTKILLVNRKSDDSHMGVTMTSAHIIYISTELSNEIKATIKRDVSTKDKGESENSNKRDAKDLNKLE